MNFRTTEVIKVVVVGDGAVGKTTFLTQLQSFTQTKSKNNIQSINRTRFSDFHTVVLSTEEKTLVFQFWDLQGQRLVPNSHPVDYLGSQIFAKAHLVLLMFAVDEVSSFDHLWAHDGWYNLIQPYLTPDMTIVVLGNKADLEHAIHIKVCEQLVQDTPELQHFFTVSALTQQGMTAFVDWLVQKYAPSTQLTVPSTNLMSSVSSL